VPESEVARPFSVIVLALVSLVIYAYLLIEYRVPVNAPLRTVVMKIGRDLNVLCVMEEFLGCVTGLQERRNVDVA
jgi:hypothetical protein